MVSFFGDKLIKEVPWDLKGPKVISLKQRYKKSDFQLEQLRLDQTACNNLGSRCESAGDGIEAWDATLLHRAVCSSFHESRCRLPFVIAVVIHFLFSLSSAIAGDVNHYKRLINAERLG